MINKDNIGSELFAISLNILILIIIKQVMEKQRQNFCHELVSFKILLLIGYLIDDYIPAITV